MKNDEPDSPKKIAKLLKNKERVPNKLPNSSKTIHLLLDAIGKEDNDSKQFGDIHITRGEISHTIADSDNYYTSDFINLLLYPLNQKISPNTIKAYPATTLEQLKELDKKITLQEENYAFIPINVAYDKEEPKHKNHWIGLIIDKKNQLMFYLDPAKKTKADSKEIEDLKENLCFPYAIILNPTNFQKKEQQEGFIRHCGAYVIEIFKVFQKYIEEGKCISGSYLANMDIDKNSISLVTALSKIPCGEAESAIEIRNDHIKDACKIVEVEFNENSLRKFQTAHSNTSESYGSYLGRVPKKEVKNNLSNFSEISDEIIENIDGDPSEPSEEYKPESDNISSSEPSEEYEPEPEDISSEHSGETYLVQALKKAKAGDFYAASHEYSERSDDNKKSTKKQKKFIKLPSNSQFDDLSSQPLFFNDVAFPYENFKNKELKTHRILSQDLFVDYHVSYRTGFYYLIKNKVIAIDTHKKGVLKRKSQEQEVGWKFHISVHNDSLLPAWAILQNVLIKYKIDYTKIVDPNLIKNSHNQITIYIFKNQDVDVEKWTKVLSEIEEKFEENAIKPSQEFEKLLVDRRISGSKYISYRHDGITLLDGRIKYLNEEESLVYTKTHNAPSYNPGNFPDPYFDLEIKDRKLACKIM